MRVMIVSPYTNSLIREHLQFSEYSPFTKAIIGKLGVLGRSVEFKDAAPWVGQLIEELEKLPEVEVVSVSPHIKLNSAIQHFKLYKTSYYYYSSNYSSALRLIKNYKSWKMLQNCSRRVMSIAKHVKPDIVIVYGTENPVVSVSQLELKKKYPVLCVLQTIYNNPDRIKYNQPNKLIQDLEHDVVRNIDYFGTEDRLYYDLLKGMNKDVYAFEYLYPRTPLPTIEPQTKKYDFVNFAFNLDARKGDEDAVRALAIVKEHHPQVTMNLAGGMTPARRTHIEHLVKELGLQDNVSFTPMFERKEDMYRHVLQSRIAVLPVKMDLISTTTREAMFYGIPVITNITPATPSINKEKQCILLAEKENIQSLAKCMLEVLENENLAKTLSENGHEYMVKQQENGKIMEKLVRILNAVVENYHQGTEIPKELLFDVNKYPLLN